MRIHPALLVGVAIAALAVLPRRANAAALPSAIEGEFFDPIPFDFFGTDPAPFDLFDTDPYALPSIEPLPIPDVVFDDSASWPALYDFPDLPIPDVYFEDDSVINVNAFLYAIRRSEHWAEDVARDLDYRTFYGRTYFDNMADHPVITGEKKGVKLPDAMCIAAGFKPGCVSTAAGAYQIIRPTWARVREAGAWGPRLPDFSRASQDEAARRLLIECGAMPRILAGDFAGAVAAASRLWASLPGSTAEQGGRSMNEVLAFYNQGLENVA